MIFCQMYRLDNLINEPTCYKNVNNPSSIDVMLTNRKSSFQDSITIETGLSDHHKMTLSVLRTFFRKKDPKIVNYRSYKKFNENLFRDELKNTLLNIDNANMNYDEFKDIFMKILNKYAPRKKKCIRGNNAAFMNKTLCKAFMHRSKLKNRFNKIPTEDNKKLYEAEKFLCFSIKKGKKELLYQKSKQPRLDVNLYVIKALSSGISW